MTNFDVLARTKHTRTRRGDRVELPRNLWPVFRIEAVNPKNEVMNEWLTVFEGHLNRESRYAEAWVRASTHATLDEHSLLIQLYYESQSEPVLPGLDTAEAVKQLQRTAVLLEQVRVPPDFDDLPERIRQLAKHFREGDKWVIDYPFIRTIEAILIEPKWIRPSRNRHNYNGLPTYDDCILVIEAALAATDDGKAEPRHTNLTSDALKKLFQRERGKINLWREWF
jgi:hypothetical protein